MNGDNARPSNSPRDRRPHAGPGDRPGGAHDGYDGYDDEAAAQFSTATPNPVRIWNCWLGGKTNFAADRAAAHRVAKIYPEITVIAHQSQAFLRRVVTYLADPHGEAHIRQFIEIGADLPMPTPTHEIAVSLQPEARTVYTSDDLLVLTHARALLQAPPPATVGYVHADRFADVETVIGKASEVIDFAEPVAVLFVGPPGFIPDDDRVCDIIGRTMAATTPGSYLGVWCATNTNPRLVAAAEALAEALAETGVRYTLRSPDEIEQWFAGMELVSPGVVPITRWRPGTADVGRPATVDAYGGVARKT